MSIYYYQGISENPWKNLAVEEYLSERIKTGDIIFYLWQNERTVVIGRNQNALRECKASLLEAEGGYLARRSTGGGAVYHDLGNLCFTFAASPECYDLDRQMKTVQDACLAFGVKTILSGRNDIITEEGYKFSGSAFSVRSVCKLQHGTIMIDVDRDMLQRYLTPSLLKLQAKGIASVRSRVCNLKELAPNITTGLLRKELLAAFRKEYEPMYGKLQTLLPENLDNERIEELYNKYSSWEWRYGKTPQCRLEISHLFSWGETQILLDLSQMEIRQCRIYSDCLDPEFPHMAEQLLTGMRFEPRSFHETEKTLQDQSLSDGSGWTAKRKEMAEELLNKIIETE